jgi:formylglycine-generating enzyme required for sulfatase activity/tRNA A-37 threonylcarbamoyl transferase component Bud32
MAAFSTATLVDALRQHQLLEPAQLEELPTLQQRCADAQAFVDELIHRGWLTAFQATLLLQGRGQELVLGAHLLLEPLGQGGMGEVFKARHRHLHRIDAVKLIRAERLANADAVRRFEREVRAAAALSHPNIVRAYDADRIGGRHLLVMEYIEGAIDLSRLVKQKGPLPVPQACEFVRQAALGLQHAHERGMVHRDIKPHNLLLTADGALIKVLDMGLARLDPCVANASASSTATLEGTIVGTPDYIAPEQALDSHTVDIRADIYSLGFTLYYLLTGQVPFAGGTMMQKILKHRREEPRPVEQLRPALPAGVAQVLRRMMAKPPEQRYQSPAEVAAALTSACGAEDTPTLNPVEQTVAEAAGSAPTGGTFAAVDSKSGRGAIVLPHRLQLEPPGRRGLRLALWSGTAVLAVSALLVVLFTASAGKKPAPEEFSLVLPPRAKLPEPAEDMGPDGAPPRAIAPFDAAKARRYQQLWATQRRCAVIETNSIGMKLALIPPADFVMGGRDHGPSEEPPHPVSLTQLYFLGVHEVTQGQFVQILNSNPSHFTQGNGGGPAYPVDSVTWDDAVKFCAALSARTEEKQAGRRYRLPTEAEWEFACRAGTTTWFSVGDELAPDQGNYNASGHGRGVPVGSYAANPFGLHDMHGNVREWCADWSADDYYAQSPKEDPPGPRSGTKRIVRGGSWASAAMFCRSLNRYRLDPAIRLPHVGFRVVCEMPVPSDDGRAR